ncbi:NERD domain-containing protein [Actinomadura craniellae]|uniref:NERD domain-containing protein n=1 Tax=Actinomadura craniellae TaxID=2231787 RepID=A0A365GYC6_9ACTN|nr:nuclease-related domain-containing protein [Actinomadura craniellae]RAY11812.1 NERD domain-containing protein [Actinomadura craniellae]
MATTDQGNDPPPRESPFRRPQGRPQGPAFGEMLNDQNIRRWALRVGISLLIGIVCAVILGIRVGFTVALVAIIADSVRAARQTTSVEAWGRSSSAERRTERQLRGLAKHGYHVLHARAVPRDDEGVSDGKIDHLVIGPSGVYAIDSEQWDKRLPVRTMSHLKLFHGPIDKKDRLDEARWEAKQASRTLTAQVGFDVPVQPSVAIYGPAIPWKVLTVRDVDVYSGGRAKAYLRRRPKLLTEEDIQQIYEAASASLPPKYQSH